ncbi:hypothetical protein HMPREF0495_00762 [Levilactobacillus brevis ATCC 14869 = DSM 20054]|uniref:Uncharacterized protein n=2 Tax=Levilactobacillus brevis TaxID=1580 RepID=U2PKL9_LEVBR|nr:hypothetical protein HMPREF0495_00762 [Levilactobacillus brevis ATCC 14869 = DSM 20054]
MLALADKEEKALIIDEVMVSEKVITAGTDISTLTMADFTSPLTYGISSKVQSDNQFSVKSVITNHWQDSANADHTTNKDFNVALVGVVAHVDGYVDQHVLTVAVGNDPFVLPAYQGTDVSFVFGITQAYSASQNVTIKMDGSAYALATDLDDVKNLQGSIGIAIDGKLKDYAKKDEVQNLIPDDIATTKNLADGDAETLKSAKEYADAQVGDKVKTTDTDNWQKAKITGDDGGNKYSFTTANTTDLVAAIQALPLGYHTFYCQAGVQGNPSSQAVRGIAEITTAGANPLGVGYLTDSTGAFWSFYVDSSGLKLKRSADVDSIDPSVIVKTTLTASDDVLNLDYGSYTISGPLPKNAPDLENTGINWGTLVVLKTLSGANKTLEYRDVKGNVLINILSGKPLTWSGWHIPNENSVVKDNGDGTVTVDGRKFVPADTDHTIPVSEAGVAGPANFAAGTLKVDDLEVLGAKVFSDTDDYKTFAAAHPSAITIVTHNTTS